MSTKSAVTESRIYAVHCARGVSEDCDEKRTLTLRDDGITSLASAEAQFREDGWKLHSDGRASCPACIAAWEG